MVSVRLIKRRADDLCTLEKDMIIKQAFSCFENGMDELGEGYIDILKKQDCKNFIINACRDYATRYNIDFVKVISVVNVWDK